MKEIRSKKGSKQIIIIIVMIMLCNFIAPNPLAAFSAGGTIQASGTGEEIYSYAADTDDGGPSFNPVIKFITFLCDSLMQFMQNSFTSNHSIANGDGTFDFQYSPAIIFSGEVMGLDINFITPNTDERNTNNYEAFLKEMLNEYYDNSTIYEADILYTEIYEKGQKLINDENYKLIKGMKGSALIPEYDYEIYYLEKDNILYVTCIFYRYTDAMDGAMYETSYNITADFLNQMNDTATYNSIANQLQPTIATWYNALRRIALVGLLSVLVYLGIRILLASSSEQGNSKYKKMLTDWLIALCLLFTLHYMMSAILVITQKLSSIFTTGTTDVLLNTLRGNIERSNTWGEALSQVIMYVVLVIYTGVFTFQYLKRVLYMAFFTMIAPLITLTYPIDKVNDGKAQAFSMWIKEYVFNALIQIVHLIVYFTLVGSAIELVKSFPLYGVIAIGFMTQGEKTIRSMFGFNNAETLGTMGAVAVGGLVTSGMNKLKSLSSGAKGGKSTSGGNSKGKAKTTKNKPSRKK